MEALGIPKQHFREILQVAATAEVRATHMLHVCRHKRRKAPETNTLLHQVREYAKERWGPVPPLIQLDTAKEIEMIAGTGYSLSGHAEI